MVVSVGFEPTIMDPESIALPLGHETMSIQLYHI